MICTSCQKGEAVVFIKTIINNKVSEQALCAPCAGKGAALEPADAFLEMLSGMSAPKARPHPPRCPQCQTTFAQFRNHGRFGCPACYDHFAPLLKDVIPRIHAGAYQHRGKKPKAAD